ncbi:hypothetical protein LTR27_011069 [Elasticomyces elasticus]|nr:hypothetical protein LTR27_011069 [Elasticomyces elasticus]
MTDGGNMANAPTLASQIFSESVVVHAERTYAGSTLSKDAEDRRQRVLGLIDQLKKLLQDPHEYLHDYVSSNWDHGALYVALQANIFEVVAEEGSAHITTLSRRSNIPADKLLRILRLLSCQSFVEEQDGEIFCLTDVSECLVVDKDFKAWVAFQLFETRVASAHLSDTLAEIPNGYQDGQSAFRKAWGAEMYEWHAQRPTKAARFRQAMRGVAQTMDPADELLLNWFRLQKVQERLDVVEIGGRYGYASIGLAKAFPNMSAKIRMSDAALMGRGEEELPIKLRSRVTFEHRNDDLDPQPKEDVETGLVAYVIRNVFWNWSDEMAIGLLRTFLPVLEKSRSTVVLVCDGVSPARNSFDPYIEQAFRRRDITMMTMHNARQRSPAEWQSLFTAAGTDLHVSTSLSTSTHVCKALFELRLKEKT